MPKLSIDRDELIAFLKLDEHKDELLFYIGACNADLYHGPRDSYEDDLFTWNGFSSGTARIRELLSDVSGTCYYDNDCGEFLSKLPEGEEIDGEWQEPFLDEIYEVDVVKELCGRELAGYCR